jgi:hypothetical protein
MTPGWNDSRPMAMRRNEDPQISAMPQNRPQSEAVKVPVFVLVVRSSTRF